MSSGENEILSGSSIIFRIPARLADIRLLSLSVRSLFTGLGFDAIDTYQLELAISESANNIVKHAYQFQKDVSINMRFATTSDRLTCTFVDEGRFENFLKNNAQDETFRNSKVLPTENRGIAIICNVMDEVSYRRCKNKNILTLVKYLS